MLVYLVMMLIVLAVWLPTLKSGKSESTSLILSFVIFFIVMAFRDTSVGSDTNNYVNIFMSLAFHTLESSITSIDSAPLYNIYSKILYDIVPHPQAIVIFNSAIICTGFAVFIWRCASSKFLATLLFVGSYSFFFAENGMRQSVAIAIVLLAVVCYLGKRNFVALVLALCSVLVHNTAAICLLVLLVGYIYLSRGSARPVKFFMIAIAASAAVLFLYDPLVALFTQVFSRYQMYTGDTSVYSFLDRNQGRQSILYLVYMFYFLIALSQKETMIELLNESYARILFVGASLAVGLGLFCSSYELFARVLYYFLPFLFCFVANVASSLDFRNKTVAFSYGAILTVGAVCAYMLFSNYGDVVPYSWCFL